MGQDLSDRKDQPWENLHMQTCIFIADAGERLHRAGGLGNPRLCQTQFLSSGI